MTVVARHPAPLRSGLVIRRATADDGAQLTALLAATSPEALYRRFLTGAVARPAPGLVRQLLAVDTGGAASLAFVDGRVAGHGMWVPIHDECCPGGRTAEIALLVTDDHQRRGIGTALMDALFRELVASGYSCVRATTLASNRAIIRMVQRRSPDARPERDGAEFTYYLPVRSAVSAVGA